MSLQSTLYRSLRKLLSSPVVSVISPLQLTQTSLIDSSMSDSFISSPTKYLRRRFDKNVELEDADSINISIDEGFESLRYINTITPRLQHIYQLNTKNRRSNRDRLNEARDGDILNDARVVVAESDEVEESVGATPTVPPTDPVYRIGDVLRHTEGWRGVVVWWIRDPVTCRVDYVLLQSQHDKDNFPSLEGKGEKEILEAIVGGVEGKGGMGGEGGERLGWSEVTAKATMPPTHKTNNNLTFCSSPRQPLISGPSTSHYQ